MAQADDANITIHTPHPTAGFGRYSGMPVLNVAGCGVRGLVALWDALAKSADIFAATIDQPRTDPAAEAVCVAITNHLDDQLREVACLLLRTKPQDIHEVEVRAEYLIKDALRSGNIGDVATFAADLTRIALAELVTDPTH